MGVGAMLKPQEFHPERIVKEIRNLHASTAVAEKCRFYAGKMRGEDGAGRASTFLEEAFYVHAPVAHKGSRP
jgi:hypothetical protein